MAPLSQDEVVVTINGRKHGLWRAVDQHGAVLDALVQRRRDTAAAKRLMRTLLGQPWLPACDDDGQATQLRGGEQRTGSERRASAVQGIEQPGGKFASADPGVREGDAAVQIGTPASTICLGPWTGFEFVHGVPQQSQRAVQTRGMCPGLRGLGKGLHATACRRKPIDTRLTHPGLSGCRTTCQCRSTMRRLSGKQ
jgi:hypothetical protein